MNSKVRILKKQKADGSGTNRALDVEKNDRQSNREIVGVIKGWIDEFKINSASRSQAALALMTK